MWFYESKMLEEIVDMFGKCKRGVGYGLLLTSLSAPISCAEVVRGVADGFGSHVGRRLGESLVGARQVRVIGEDGRVHTKLVPQSNYNPVMDPNIKDMRSSPDRKYVVFSAKFGKQHEIFKCNKDGSNLERLSFTPNSSEVLPTYSPDGKKVGFLRFRHLENNNPILKNYIMIEKNNIGLRYINLENGVKVDFGKDVYDFFVKKYKNKFKVLDDRFIVIHQRIFINIMSEVAKNSELKWTEDSKDVKISW